MLLEYLIASGQRAVEGRRLVAALSLEAGSLGAPLLGANRSEELIQALKRGLAGKPAWLGLLGCGEPRRMGDAVTTDANSHTLITITEEETPS